MFTQNRENFAVHDFMNSSDSSQIDMVHELTLGGLSNKQ